MHPITPALRNVLLGTAAAAVFVATTHGQSILGPPSEANHFIETPRGLGAPEDAVGRARHRGHAEHDAGRECAARTLRQQLSATAVRRAT